MIAAASDAIVVTDSNGVILLWNAAAESIFGHAAADAVGRSIDLIVPMAMRGEHRSGMRRIHDGGPARLIGKPVEVPGLRADGSTLPIELRLSTWTSGGDVYFGAVIRELDARRNNEELLHSLAHFDQLTMLPNRARFLSALDRSLRADPHATLLIVNLDRFAEVNDRVGHSEADDLLRETAVALKRFSRRLAPKRGEVGRIGPNEFTVLLPGLADLIPAVQAAADLERELSGLHGSDGRPVTASIGVAVAPEHGGDAGRLLANADFAMRRAKLLGGASAQLFQPQQREVVRARRDLELALTAAWEAGEFEVHYQPQVRLRDHEIVGVEALLRWRHPTQGLILPGLFMHAMADLELSELIGDFVLDDACRHAAAWRDLAGRPIRVGVNLFERQFMRPEQPERIEHVLAKYGLAPELLELEIIETIMTSSDEASIRRVRRLRDIGVGIAFDDYGTGYASLGLLKRYPITTLKIDRAFVREVDSDANDLAIVELVLTLGRRFGFRVVAEGVETAGQAEMLLALGCDEAQGFLFGRPVPAAAISAALGAPPRRKRGSLVA